MIHGGCFSGRAPSVMPLLILLDQFAQLLLQPVLLWLLTCQLLSRWLLAGRQLLCHLLSLQVLARSNVSNLLYYICRVAASCESVCGFGILLRGLAMLCYANAMLCCVMLCCAMLCKNLLPLYPPHIPTKRGLLLIHLVYPFIHPSSHSNIFLFLSTACTDSPPGAAGSHSNAALTQIVSHLHRPEAVPAEFLKCIMPNIQELVPGMLH